MKKFNTLIKPVTIIALADIRSGAYAKNVRDSQSHELAESEGFRGYWYTGDGGRAKHTWDFEESIGE